mgnify:CR=1 FL=1
MTMKFDILTLFPGIIDAFANETIIGRAKKKGIIEVNAINIRDYSEDKHKRVDDYPYGAGGGMVMQVMPIYNAYQAVIKNCKKKPHVIYTTPQGKIFTQERAKELAKLDHIVILCGHYEGVDERIIEEIVDEEISIGDYVLTGGELPALILVDAISRMVEGVLDSKETMESESLYNYLLEYPQYTRPYEVLGRKVPDILLSGHEANIKKWRLEQSIKRTKEKRPDLYEKYLKSLANGENL